MKKFLISRKKIVKSLSKGRKFFETRRKFFEKVSIRLRVTFSQKFGLSKVRFSEVKSAHTQHSPTLVPPPRVCADEENFDFWLSYLAKITPIFQILQLEKFKKKNNYKQFICPFKVFMPHCLFNQATRIFINFSLVKIYYFSLLIYEL